MKKIFKLLLVSLLALGAAACEGPEEENVPEQLEVTPNNIAGSWALSQMNGEALPEWSYVYIDFVRSDRTFTLYQNVDSFGTRTLTGRYFIYVDEELGVAVIRGEYDHGMGEWNHRYIVSSLTANEMALTAKDNEGDVCVYTRGDIPAEIVGE